MPFTSKAQQRACWAAYGAAKKAGKTPSWDCHEWAAESPSYADLPETSAAAKRRARSTSPKKSKKGKRASSKTGKSKKGANRKVHTGPRGGKYLLSNGRKIYLKD